MNEITAFSWRSLLHFFYKIHKFPERIHRKSPKAVIHQAKIVKIIVQNPANRSISVKYLHSSIIIVGASVL